MQQRHVVTIALFLATSLPAPCVAQSRLQPADRVRVLTVTGTSLTGILAEIAGDSLRVTVNRESWWLRRGDLAYLERSSERYRQFARNFALTTASGAGVGAMLGAITWKECVSNSLFGCMFVPESRSDAFFAGALAGAFVSLPVGVIVGLALQYDRWEPTRLAEARRSGLSVRPMFGGGPGLTASFSF
jgi:hypothetical protein